MYKVNILEINMCSIALFFILLAILISCGLQNPAPVLLKGEEFYGKRDLEYTREYHLIKENINSSPQKESRKAFINKVYENRVQSICKFIIPVKDAVTSFDEMCHDGVKVIAQSETKVIASAPGKVIYVGKGLRWYGSLIVVEHRDNYMTMYSYLKNIQVEIGDKVKQGQVIGSAGKSSTQDKDPQMCFTMRHNGQAVNPLIHIRCD